MSLYSQDDVKKYDASSELFKDIPKEIAKILLHDFTDLLSEDFTTLAKYDPMTVPNGIPVTTKPKVKPYSDLLKDSDAENEEKYLEELQNELHQKDIFDLKNDKGLKAVLPKISKEEQESEDEEEEENEEGNWKGRLRKRVVFSAQ